MPHSRWGLDQGGGLARARVVATASQRAANEDTHEQCNVLKASSFVCMCLPAINRTRCRRTNRSYSNPIIPARPAAASSRLGSAACCCHPAGINHEHATLQLAGAAMMVLRSCWWCSAHSGSALATTTE